MSAPTLPEFLLARYAEEEAVGVTTQNSYDPLPWDGDMPDGAWLVAGPVDGPSGYQSIVMSPARVLAECDAKRQIVDMCRPDAKHRNLDMLQRLALPYADHPDYRQEWKP